MYSLIFVFKNVPDKFTSQETKSFYFRKKAQFKSTRLYVYLKKAASNKNVYLRGKYGAFLGKSNPLVAKHN